MYACLEIGMVYDIDQQILKPYNHLEKAAEVVRIHTVLLRIFIRKVEMDPNT